MYKKYYYEKNVQVESDSPVLVIQRKKSHIKRQSITQCWWYNNGDLKNVIIIYFVQFTFFITFSIQSSHLFSSNQSLHGSMGEKTIDSTSKHRVCISFPTPLFFCFPLYVLFCSLFFFSYFISLGPYRNDT